ncbi:MAG: polysaccharide biosynthesis tyrosine autokinase [Candidatus Stahlbacteria bacterium]|nr:polysaccharide biosynthesis tyrosine autokinase [Candidatus Stahlbacteria bacterium]
MEKETAFQDYLYVLFTKKWIILAIFVAIFGTTLFYTFTATKVYRATATIIIEPKNVSTSQLAMARFSYPTINTRNYCEILNSKAVAEHAAIILKDRGSKFSFLNSICPGETLLTFIDIEPIMESDIIRVNANSGSPDAAASIANAIVDAFIEEQLSTARRGIAEQCKFLDSQIPITEANLEESEKKIKEFKEKNKIVSLSDEATELAKVLTEFDKLYGESEVSCNALQNQLALTKQQLNEQKATLLDDITKVSTPHISLLRKQLTDLQTSYSLYLVQGLSKDNPKLVDLQNSIDGTKSKIVEETKKIIDKQIPSLDPLSSSQELVDGILKLEIELGTKNAEKKALSKIINQYEDKLCSLPASEFKLAQLERARAVNANAYELLVSSYKETQISESGTISNVRIVDRAGTSQIPIKPKKKLNLLLGGIVGIVLAIGGAFLIDYISAPVRTTRDVQLCTNLAVISSIPRVSKSNKLSLLINHSPSYVSEAYKILRTNIGFTNPDSPVKVILVTSATPKEGKSTIASNLAIAMAQLGKNVLLADADLRKPTLTKIFNLENNNGITNVLIRETDISSAIVSTAIENLSLISSGKIPPNPSELLESHQMDILIETLKEKFDYVIFDTPPAVGVTDAVILSKKIDGVLIVVEAGRTNKFMLSHIKENFERVNAHLLGIVLNKVFPIHPSNGYYHYRSHYHS